MRIFVTAGNTQAPIDRVRCITNIFTGRTGAGIALEAYSRGHQVMLATSHPDVIEHPSGDRWHCRTYRTFDDLETLMADQIADDKQDAVVHCAAVSDYRAAGIYAPAPGVAFDPGEKQWHGNGQMLDRSAGKVKSSEPELWLRLVRAPKLVDRIRTDWKYHGLLVKFKLEVGISEDELLVIAEKSRLDSDADWMVANSLEGAAEWALLGNALGYTKVTRDELSGALLDVIETHWRERNVANVLLGVTGSVAAIYTPNLYADLRTAGHAVKIVATKSATYFFDVSALDDVVVDEDEWPGERYQRGDPVLHIELRRWAEMLLIAPLDANTLAKLALGLTDNCLTCVYRAWDRTKPIVLAPAMNTLMWEHPVTARHLAQLHADLGPSLRLVLPIEKKLACDDVGVGAMAERPAILAALGESSP